MEVLASGCNRWSGRCGYQQCIRLLVRSNLYYTRVSLPPESRDRPLRAGIYCRVSHDSSGRGSSVADQEKEGRRWCEHNGYTISWVIVDNDLSASRAATKERPGYSRVRSNLLGDDPVDVLVAWESSRLQRDLNMYVHMRDVFERSNTLLSYNGRLYDLSRIDDRFTTGMDALIDERYAAEISERVLRAVRARVENGRAHGKIPYGYQTIYDAHTGAPIGREPEPETAKVVREIVQRVLAGEPSYQISKDLNQRGVITPHGFRSKRLGKDPAEQRPWTINLVRHIASNPTYAALRTHNGESKGNADWPALVTVAEHRRVVAWFSDPSRKNTRDREIKHLLAGIAACGVCGAPCRRYVNHGYPSYQCNGRHCVSRLQVHVDAWVTEWLLARLEKPNARAVFVDDDVAAEVLMAMRELEDLEARLAEIRQSMFRVKGISGEALALAEAHYGPLIEDARRRSVPAHVPTVVRDLVESSDVRESWSALSVAQKRSVVRHLVTVTIFPATRGRHGFDPSRVNVEWRGAGRV